MEPDDLADLLLELTTSLTVELHPAIADVAMPGHFEPAGMPAAAVFHQPAGGDPIHRSGPASDAVAALAIEAAARAHDRLGYGRRDGNPLLPALSLAAFYLVEARRSGTFGLGALPGGRVRTYPLTPDEARHDPSLLPGTAAIRAWFPVEGAPDACVELRLSPAPAAV
ncbi:MAG TPA: hypothetical protein VHL51_05455 [Gaiellales bacterium]|nr:hypothetical protein [Gaiellales bacterium]